MIPAARGRERHGKCKIEKEKDETCWLEHVYIMLNSFSDSTKTILFTCKNGDLRRFLVLLSSFPLRRADLILTEVDGHLSGRFLCLSWWQCGKVFMLGRSISCVDMTSHSLTFIHMITYIKQMRVPFSLVCKNKHF